MSSRFTIITSMLAVAAGVSGAGAQEAAFPNKPIRLIMPNAPGSSNDVLSRLLAIKLGEILGQQVVIDNRAGAGGTIGVETAAHAIPDGYTLVAASSATHSIAPHVYSKLNYDVNRDFTPISLFVITQNLLAVHPSIPAKTVREFIDYAKSKPGTLNMASAGAGSTSHLAGVMFTTLTNIQSVHVPYKGGGPSVAAVVAGEAQWVFTPIAGPLPHVRSGRLRALAVGGVQRSPVAPEIPTVAESGVPDTTRAAGTASWVRVVYRSRSWRSCTTRSQRRSHRPMSRSCSLLRARNRSAIHPSNSHSTYAMNTCASARRSKTLASRSNKIPLQLLRKRSNE